jgi:flagellar basal body-associated protein FliL
MCYIDGVIRYNLALAAGAVNPEQASAILVKILFSIVIFAVVYGAISFFLSGVLKAIENGEPFQSNNARRISSIGIVFLVGSFFVGTAQASTADVIIHAMGLTEVLTVNYSANSIMIAAGLLMLILSGIFRYGSYLQEEYDVTL